MGNRQWIYDTLASTDLELMSIISNRVIQGEALTTVSIIKPFLVYRIGNDTDEGFGEDEVQPYRSFFQVYIHDEPGDYDRIDTLCEIIKALFRTMSTERSNGVITVRYLETSRDLSDSTLGTIFRYMRFQLIVGR